MSMRFSAVFVLALAGAPLAAAQAGGHAHDHHNNHHHNHHHEHSASAEMESLQRPADGGKWATDEPLRQGMGELNEAFAEHHRAFEEGEFDSGSAAELATSSTTRSTSCLPTAACRPSRTPSCTSCWRPPWALPSSCANQTMRTTACTSCTRCCAPMTAILSIRGGTGADTCAGGRSAPPAG